MSRTTLQLLLLAAFASLASGADLLVPSQYPAINAAYFSAKSGDRILVAPGTYSVFPLGINVPNLTIQSTGGPGLTTLKAPGGTLFSIRANNTCIIGFTITGGEPFAGVIGFQGVAGGCIKQNVFVSNYQGVDIVQSTGIVVSGNAFHIPPKGFSPGVGVFANITTGIVVESNTFSLPSFSRAITLQASQGTMVSSNVIQNSSGSAPSGGIALLGTSLGQTKNITISGNSISSVFTGIRFQSAANVTIVDNIFESNTTAMEGLNIAGLVVYHNIFSNSPLSGSAGQSQWFNSSLLEGNYWSNYTGKDDGSGTGKHSIAGDYIGDTSVPWPSTGFDQYPFLYPNLWSGPHTFMYVGASTTPASAASTHYVTPITSVTLTAISSQGGIDHINVSIDGSEFAVYSGPMTFPEGAHTLVFQAVDLAGRVEKVAQTMSLNSIAAPTTTLSTGTPSFIAPDGTLYISPVTSMSLTATNLAVGVNRIEVSIDSEPFFVYTSSLSFSEGSHTMQYYAVDNVGNVEPTHFLALKSDASPPITDLTVSISNFTSYVSSDTVFTLNAVDPLNSEAASGLKFTQYRVNNGPFVSSPLMFGLSGSDGDYLIEYQSQDNIGNLEVLRSTTVLLDQTPPMTSVAVGVPQYMGSDEVLWLTPATPLTFSAIDPSSGGVASGVKHIEVAIDGGEFSVFTTSLTLAEGPHTLLYRAVDNAGNAEAQRTLTLQSDATPPTSAFSISTPSFVDIDASVYVTPATSISFTAIDPASGVSNVEISTDGVSFATFTSSLGFVEGVHTVFYRAMDNVGNVEGARTLTLNSDDSPPLTSLVTSTPMFNGYVSSASILTILGDDMISDGVASGLKLTQYRINGASFVQSPLAFGLSGPDGAYMVDYQSVDNVDNIEVLHSTTILLDQTPPETTALIGAPQFADTDGTVYVSTITPVAFSTIDTLNGGFASGVERLEVSVDGAAFETYTATMTFFAGAHTVLYRATDNVGNTEATRTLVLQSDGMAPVTSVAIGTPSFITSDGTQYVAPTTPVSLIAIDDAAGVQSIEVSIDSAAFAAYAHPLTFAEGSHMVMYRAVDSVGNIESVHTLTLKSDATPPQVSLDVSTPLYGGFVSSATVFAISANDPISNDVTSGLKLTQYRVNGGPFTSGVQEFSLSGTDGIYDIDYQSVDNVDNATVLRSTRVVLDRMTPVTTANIGVPSSVVLGTTYVTPATPISFAAVDPTSEAPSSGIDFIQVSVDGGPFVHYITQLIFPEGQHTVLYGASDNVGNFEPIQTLEFISKSPPAKIENLIASAPDSHSVILTWTATGQSGNAGQATSYDLRYSPNPIVDDASFYSAAQVANMPAPKPAGADEIFAVSGLDVQTQYYFAIRAIDSIGVTSPLSDVAQSMTTGEAAMAAYVGLPASVVSGQSASLSVLVTDAMGNPVPRVTVTFSMAGGSGSVAPTSVQTGASGLAQTVFTAPGTNEVNTIKATVPGFQILQAQLIVVTASLAAIEGFPTTPLVFTGGPTTISTSSLAYQWLSVDPTGISDNFLMIGSQGDLALGDWVETNSPGVSGGLSSSFLTALNGYLYFFGGGSTRYSQIQSDGSLGPWQTTLVPPSAVTSGFVYNGQIYILAIGGAAYRPTIDSSGRVTAWSQVGPDFLIINRSAFDAGVSGGGFAYTIGGNGAFQVSRSSLVYVAKIQSNGTIPAVGQPGGWKQTTPLPAFFSDNVLPAPRLVSIGAYLYVIGGTSAQTVFFARPNPDGTIPAAGQSGSWAPTTQLLESNSGITALAYNNAIYLVGGDNGDINALTFTARSFRAVPNADGTIPAVGSAGSWRLSTRLPSAGTGRTVAAGNHIYLHDLSGKVRFAEVLPNGNMGSWRRLTNRVLTGPIAGASPTQRRSFTWTSVPVPGGSWVYLFGGVPQGSNTPAPDVFKTFMPTPFVESSGLDITQLAWSPEQALPKGLRDSAAVQYNGFVYVLGGTEVNGDPSSTIYSAAASGNTRQNPMQNPLQWAVAGQLPGPYANLIAAVFNGRLYITGVGLGGAEVYGAALSASGTVGAFTKMANLPPISNLGSVTNTILAHRGFLYIATGNQFYSAVLDQSGAITSWRLETGIPTGGGASGPLKFGLAASNQTLYATGGAGDINPLSVYSAVIGNNGVLGPWTAIGHMPEVRNTGVAIIHDDRILTFGPRMDFPPSGEIMAQTGTFYPDALSAPIHLSGNEVYNQSVGADTDFFGTNLALLRGQTYFASVRTKNPAGIVSQLGASSGVSILPASSPPDILPPRTALHIGLPSAGANPTFISPGTPLTFTTFDDRATLGDNSGDGVRTIIALLDGVVISTDPTASVMIDTEGPHVFSFYGIDLIGNTEPLQQLGVIVDGSSPATQIVNPLPFDVLSGSYTIVEGVAADTFTFIDRVLVSTNNNVSFSTAVIFNTADGLAYWRFSAPLPALTSTMTISAHAIDLLGNFDALGSSVPVIIFNVVNTTMAVAANPRVVSPGSLVLIQAQVATQLGGPLQGTQVVFSAVVANTLESGEATGGIPLPAVSFAPSVAVTDAYGIATTTLAIGGFDGQFTALVDKYAAAQFCIQVAPLVGATPAACPNFATTAAMASYMLGIGITNGTLSTQAQVDSVQAQMGVIAQEQFDAASAAIFDKSIGVIKVTAQVEKTLLPPFVSSASVTVNLLSLPYPIDLTGLPTDDGGEQPNSITYGDNNTTAPLPMPGQIESGFGQPQPDSDLISFGQTNSGASGSIGTLSFFDDVQNAFNDVSKVFNDVTNFLDPARISSDKMFAAGDFVNNMAGNYILSSVPGARLALLASAYGMDLLMGNHQSRDLVASAWGDRAGMSLADLTGFGILPDAITKLIPSGLTVGLDVSGALAGKPTFGVSAGYKNDAGLNLTYNSGSGLNLSQQINGLQTNFSKAGFSSSFNLGSIIADQPLGQLAQQYGFKSLSVGLLTGSYTGRMKLDIANIKTDFDENKFIKALGDGIDTDQFSMSGFGNLFSNLPSWSAGAAISFRDIGISFGQNSVFGNLGFGKIALPKPPFQIPAIGQKVPIAPNPDILGCFAAPSVSSIGSDLFASANSYQSVSVDNGYFNAVNTVSGMTNHPVNSATGNLLYSAQDALVKGKPLFIQLVRIYNSLDFGAGPLGNGWSFNYGMTVSPYGQDGVIAVRWGDGSRKVFLPNADGTYRSPYATQSTLSKNPGGTFTLTQKHGTRYRFNAAGRLALITDKNGNTITLAYSGAALIAITDSTGKSLAFVHDALGRIIQMTDPSGAVTSYTYNGAGDLIKVSAPGYAAEYGYDTRHGLTSYQDTRSQTGFPKGGFTYNEFRQVLTELDGLGNRVSTLSYALVNNGIKTTISDANSNRTVDLYDSTGAWLSRTNPLGGVSQFVFNAAGQMTRITEPDGALTQLSYDSKGNKTAIIDPAGAQYQYSYDAKNNLVSALLPNAAQISRTYDAAGNLTSVTDAEGGISRFTYNTSGLMTSYTDAANKTTGLTYDPSGNLAVVTRPGGGQRTLTHDTLGRLTATTDENGNTTSFGRTAAGYLAAITYPEGQTYTFAYDANGKLARRTDQMGKSLNYVNDERGLPVQVTDAAGGVTLVEYDAAGRLTRRTDRTGGVFTREYDALNRITRDVDPRGGAYQFAYDAAGRRTAITDPTGSALSLAYDVRGRPITITSPEGSVTSLAYDSMGNLVSQTDPNGGVTAYVHDKTGLVTKVTDAKGQNTLIHYDPAGRADTVTPPNGAVQSFVYNPDGFLVTQTDGGGRSVRYAVDPAGRLTSVTDGLNRVTQYAHRWNGQVTSLTRADGAVVNFAYDARGALTTITDANGNVTSYDHTDTGLISKVTDAKGKAILYGYDAGGRPTSVTYPDGSAYRMNYDSTGLLTSFIDPMGKTHSYTYDLSGQMLTDKDANGGQWSFVYDQDGRMTEVTDPVGGTARYAYDNIGNVLSQTNPNGGVTSFVYDAIGQMTQGTDPAGGVVKFTYDGVGNLLTKRDANGNVTAYVYNNSNDLVSITDAAGFVRSFVYDLAGQLTSATGPLGDVTAYAYDLVGRLSRNTNPIGAVESFTYDAMGNRLTATDPLGRLTSFVYDTLNRTVSITDPTGTQTSLYDDMGRVLSQTDAAGHVTQFVYQADGLPISQIAPDGSITRYEYDANGNRSAIVDPAGNRTTLQYDALNRITRTTFADGAFSTLAYDANGNQTSVTDAKSAVTTYVYDAMNRIVTRTDPSGGASSLAYDPAGNQTQATDPLGKITTFIYDALNRLVQLIDPAGAITAFTFDAEGSLLTTKDPTGAVSARTYDVAGRLTSVSDPIGSVTGFVYDLANNLLTTTDALGRALRKTYDDQGRVATITDALGRTTRFAYDSSGNRTSITDAQGNVMRFEYDANGRLTAQTDPMQNRIVYAYDSRGNKTSETDPEGHVTRFEYDQDNRISAVVDARGSRRTFAYDGNGQTTTETAPDGAVTKFEYDSNGRLSATIDPLSHRVTRNYDVKGNLLRITDARGNATQYAYDDLGRLVQVSDAEGGIWTYSYDAAGQLTKILDANNHSQTFTYDAAGRLVAQADALGNTTGFEYDALGNRKKLIKPTGEELRYEYDAGNRITRILDQAAAVLATLNWDSLNRLANLTSPDITANYVYDAAGRLTRLSYPTINKTLDFAVDRDGMRTSLTLGSEQVSYAYDDAHRLTSLVAPIGRGGQARSSGAYTFTYDAVGRPLTRSYPNGVIGSYEYDFNGRLLNLAYRKSSGTLLDRYTYTYDANGNRLSMEDNLGRHSYVYDKLNRLGQNIEPFGLTQTYGYDSVGNRTNLVRVQANPTKPVPPGQPASVTETINYTYDLADRILGAGATTYASDAAGRITSIRRSPGTAETLSYDAFDRPNRISGLLSLAGDTLPDNSFAYAPQLPDLRFTPAPLGGRVKKVDSSGVTQYLLDNTGNVAAELDQNGAIRRRFTHSPQMDDPLAITDEHGHTEFMLTDGLGSVGMLVDEQGDPVQNYSYDVYGKPNVLSSDKNAVKYTGREFDTDSRLQYNRSRYYEPDTGRWLTRDPLATALQTDFFETAALSQPQTLNRCTYVANNPATYSDPLGLRLRLAGPTKGALLDMLKTGGRLPLTMDANGEVSISACAPIPASNILGNLVRDTVNHPKSLAVFADVGGPNVFIDSFAGKTIYAGHLLGLPEYPPASAPELHTRYEALTHIMAEYLEDLRGTTVIPTFTGTVFDHAHEVGRRTQNAYRVSIGQKRHVVNQTVNWTNQTAESIYDDGSRTRISFPAGTVTGSIYVP